MGHQFLCVVDAVVTATNSGRAAGRILTRRAVRRRGKTGSPHCLGDPRSSVSCAAVTFRARFTPLRACHGAHRRASQNAPCGARAAGCCRQTPTIGDGRHAAAANLRAARRRRQTGKHFAGETAGQVTDLHPTAQACAAGTPDLAGSRPLGPEKCFPAPSSGSPSRMCPGAAGTTCSQGPALKLTHYRSSDHLSKQLEKCSDLSANRALERRLVLRCPLW